MTSHELGRELLNRKNEYITATIGEYEYVIDSIKKLATHSNLDDGITYYTLNLRDAGQGNIKR